MRVKVGSESPTPPERALDLTLLCACEIAEERDYSHFAIIDEKASNTGQVVYCPELSRAALDPGRGLLIKFFASKPKGIFSFHAHGLQRILSKRLGFSE